MAFRQIHPNLSLELGKQLRVYSAAKRVTETAVVRAALIEYFNNDKDWDRLWRRLNTESKANARNRRDLTLLMEGFGVFVQMWLAHNPDIPTSQVDSAKRSAALRYQKYLDYVVAQFSNGHRFASEATGPTADGLDDATEPTPAQAGEDPAR